MWDVLRNPLARVVITSALLSQAHISHSHSSVSKSLSSAIICRYLLV